MKDRIVAWGTSEDDVILTDDAVYFEEREDDPEPVKTAFAAQREIKAWLKENYPEE